MPLSENASTKSPIHEKKMAAQIGFPIFVCKPPFLYQTKKSKGIINDLEINNPME
jgi:hypothetical protein